MIVAATLQVMCRAHYRGHTTTGKFACHVCNYVFRHKHHLQRHLAKIHALDDAAIIAATCASRHQPMQVITNISTLNNFFFYP
jgi:hypothetical protein